MSCRSLCEVYRAQFCHYMLQNHSNGQTEGHITKLKLIKRMMYGRAGFPLLRQRMLHCA